MKLLPVALLIGGALPCLADYVVDVDLGVLPIGTTPLSGTTAATEIDPGPPPVIIGGRNNSIFPKGLFEQGPELNWGNEIVYRFELAQPAIVSITSSFILGDPDFFLLDGLATSVDIQTGKLSADNAIAAVLLDFGPPETESYPALLPGTYYLAVEPYLGPDGQVVPADAEFDVDLEVEEAAALDFPIDLGHIARAGTPFTLDTFGSDFDTELAVYDLFGGVVAENDDAGDGEQSALDFDTGLPAGDYYAVIAGYDTVFDPNFVLSPGGEVGSWTLNFPLGPNFSPGIETGVTDAFHPATESQYFFFSINPAPVDVIDLGTIANADQPVVINTNGSSFDTQLGLFDSEGFLLAFNDDINFNAGNLLSELRFNLGLSAGDYFLALAGYPNFYADGFLVTVDTRFANSSEGGDFNVNHPLGVSSGTLPVSAQEWFSFRIGAIAPESIKITDLDFNPATNEFTVAWDSGQAGPFNIFVGTAADLSGLTAPPGNVLPTLAVTNVTSPATFTVPVALQGEPQLFLQVTD